jgi:hypothetical protein
LKHKLSEVRKKNFRVICRAMNRYELFVRETKRGQKSFALDIDTITADTLHDMWEYFENEHILFRKISAYFRVDSRKKSIKAAWK